MHLDQARYHLAFAVAHGGHINPEPVPGYAELPAPAHVGGNLRRMNDVFAGQASDVGTRSSHVFPLDHRDMLSLSGEGPCSELRSGAAAEDHKIVFLGSRFAG
jgi:hypothetical protein